MWTWLVLRTNSGAIGVATEAKNVQQQHDHLVCIWRANPACWPSRVRINGERVSAARLEVVGSAAVARKCLFVDRYGHDAGT